MEAYCKGGKGPPWAVAPPKKKFSLILKKKKHAEKIIKNMRTQCTQYSKQMEILLLLKPRAQ